MGQYRDKFYADNAGLPYTFPPLESKKRKRPTAPVEPSTRKPRSAGIAALTRVSALPRSRSGSEDSDSNTSSANEANELEDWAVPRTQRVSRRRRSLRQNEMYGVMEDGEGFGPSEEEEEWVRYNITSDMSDLWFNLVIAPLSLMARSSFHSQARSQAHFHHFTSS